MPALAYGSAVPRYEQAPLGVYHFACQKMGAVRTSVMCLIGLPAVANGDLPCAGIPEWRPFPRDACVSRAGDVHLVTLLHWWHWLFLHSLLKGLVWYGEEDRGCLTLGFWLQCLLQSIPQRCLQSTSSWEGSELIRAALTKWRSTAGPGALLGQSAEEIVIKPRYLMS